MRRSAGWGWSGTRGFIDQRLEPFTFRIEHEVSNGIPWTNIYASRETHRMFAWMTLPLDNLRKHPDGVVRLERRLVQQAYEKALANDAEIAAIAAAWLDPQPPDQPTRVRLVS